MPDSKIVRSRSLTRRQFLRYSTIAAGAAATTFYLPAQPRKVSPNEKLNIGFVGIGGKGRGDLEQCSGENVVALCDVDSNSLMSAHNRHPNAKTYRDFRKLLETEEKNLDAVVIATPDHLHASVAAIALKMGKHVYCQKPLTQTVYEARLLRRLAKENKVATQMGNQGSAEDGLRRAVEVVQAGVIGPVRQVYVWTNRPIWPQGMDRPAGEDPVPDSFDWDLWLGPAPKRPYKASWPGESTGRKGGRRNGIYHPFNWRGWQDFGTGALGDMACHTANMPFRALKLGYPTEIEAECPSINKESYPLKSKIRFEFPAREGQPPLTFWWYDGGNASAGQAYRHDGSNKPPAEVTAAIRDMLDKVPGSGCLLIGDKGQLFSPDDYGTQFFIKLKDEKELTDGRSHEAVKVVPKTIPRNTHPGGGDPRHHLEWIAACKGGPTAYSDFDIAAYLTEIILLGCVALRVGKKLEWDGPNMKATNAPEAARIVKREYREGWSI